MEEQVAIRKLKEISRLHQQIQRIIESDTFENEDDDAFESGILSQMTEHEVHSLRFHLNDQKPIRNQLDWTHISSALMHELDEKISYHVMNVVKRLNISKIELTEEMEKKLNKKMTKQEINYTKKLVERAIKNTTNVSLTSRSATSNQQSDASHENDLDGLSANVLIDIFNVFRAYKYNNFHFEDYRKEEFIKAIKNNPFLTQNKDEIINTFDERYANHEPFILYPIWLIDDDQFSIWNYFFSCSYIVNKLRANKANATRNHLKFHIYIIPNKITSIYDENIVFPVRVASDISAFLTQNGFNQFSRTSISESICYDTQKLLEILEYYLKPPSAEYLSRDILLIVDRRKQNENILYILNASANDNKLVELHQNHLVGMQFNIFSSDDGCNVAQCYFIKGIAERIRFLPEYLTFLMCRLFKKQSDKMSDYEYMKKVYASSYRHAFGTDLSDRNFHKYYKLILNSLNISVNYNRDYVASELSEDNDKNEQKYDTNVENEWKKECNLQQVQHGSECPYIYFITQELDKFAQIDDYQLNNKNSAMFDELSLSLALDHLISVHLFCFDEKRRTQIQKFVQSKNGLCQHDKQCVVLQQYCNRAREKKLDQNRIHINTKKGTRTHLKLDNKNIKINMLTDSLYTLHCYLKHDIYKVDRRTNIAGNNNKFGTIVQHNAKLLKYFDQFDALRNKLLHLNEDDDEEKEKILVFMSNVNKWCEQNEFDFDSLVDDVVDCEVIESNLYQYLLSIKKESYFAAVYKEIFNINHEGINEQDMNCVDALKAYLINNNRVSLQSFAAFAKWITINNYDWNKINLDINDKTKSRIYKAFGGNNDSLIGEIETFIKEQEKYEQSARIDNICAINFGVSIHEWLQFNELPKYKSFRDEIINGSMSTIDEHLYEIYKEESIILVAMYENQFVLLEIMCIKFYTDTTELCKQFRMAFWKSSSKKNKKMKKEFYQWALALFKTMLYHSKPLDKLLVKHKNPMILYHGLSEVFILDDNCPFYNGPISTTFDLVVAERFTVGSGLRWNICGSYSNPFKFIYGLKVIRISCFREENEILLYNSYLPISSTQNYEEDEETKIDLFMKQIKMYKQKEINAAHFYSQIGFKFNKSWIQSIKAHPLLYQPLDIDQNKMVLHKLRTAFNIIELDAAYIILSARFEEVHAFKKFATIFKLNYDEKYAAYFKECKYKLIFDEEAKSKTIKYDESIQSNATDTNATILVSNRTVFETDDEFKVQQISITAEQSSTAADFVEFYPESQKFTVNPKLIPSTQKDILEAIRNAKYQIKYKDMFNVNSASQFGEEYKCSTLAKFENQFKNPPNVTHENNKYQMQLMVSPLIHKTSAKKSNGKWLKYRSNMDENGVFYGLATNFHQEQYLNPAKQRKLRIISSQNEEGIFGIVGREPVKLVVSGKSKKDPAFFYVDIGEFGLKASKYMLRNSIKDCGYLINWKLLASNDGMHWILLKEHINDTALKNEGELEAAAFDIYKKDDDHKTDEYFSYFKILMSGTNHVGGWNFGCCGFELYGHLIKDNSHYVYGEMSVFKSYLPKTMRSTNPIVIDYKLNVDKFDIKTGCGGTIDIYSKSTIIIEKNGSINADDCVSFRSTFKYVSDCDKNGLLYAIATHFGSQEYENPAVSGLVEIVSSGMLCGKSSAFIGRENVEAWTADKEGSFFDVNLKQYRLRPTAYTLKNSYDGEYALKSWNLEASNDAKTWKCLKEHKNDDSLKEDYKSQTWKLSNMNEFFSFFRIQVTDKNHIETWHLPCSGFELYGDLFQEQCGGSISLISDSSVINRGNISSKCSKTSKGGTINIKCSTFKNCGVIETETNADITIECKSFENKTTINPKPIIIKT